MNHNYTQVKKQVEAIRRSERTNMLDKSTVKKLAVECNLNDLAMFLIEVDDREVDTPTEEDYMSLIKEAGEFRGVDDPQIDVWADKVRNEKVMVEL